jgi:hypothetical protein
VQRNRKGERSTPHHAEVKRERLNMVDLVLHIQIQILVYAEESGLNFS